jgi:hypothetical protein
MNNKQNGYFMLEVMFATAIVSSALVIIFINLNYLIKNITIATTLSKNIEESPIVFSSYDPKIKGNNIKTENKNDFKIYLTKELSKNNIFFQNKSIVGVYNLKKDNAFFKNNNYFKESGFMQLICEIPIEKEETEKEEKENKEQKKSESPEKNKVEKKENKKESTTNGKKNEKT